ncbi:class I SAM-dependent methyltransferase [Polynucleobacter paneuropaeus]|nr:class I SAM-dependent methyltransferase [Polynucleobacter paneuropaeus]
MNNQSELNSDYSGKEALWDIENALINYSQSIVNSLSSIQAPNTKSVLEFGAGIGTLAKLMESKTGIKPDCIEIDPKLQEILQTRQLTVYPSLSKIQKKYDLIYTSNVLEHIENDIDSLKEIHSSLSDGGILSIYVPAFMFLYSKFDKRIGHVRRYELQELRKKVSDSGFQILVSQYPDSLGFFAWLLSKYSKDKNDEIGSTKKLIFYDKYLYPISQCLDRLGLRFILGKNILLIAKKV